MKTVCIYHAECIDGAASAAVVAKKYPDVILAPTHHGMSPPQNLKGKRVFIVDFSFSASIMREIHSHASEVCWYDHHKTAIPIQKEIGWGVIDLLESGATLTWKQVFPKKKVPKILQYVRDKDIWLWKLPKSREINSDIREVEKVFDPKNKFWKKMLQGGTASDWKKMIERGSHSRRLLQERIRQAASKGFEVSLDGHKTLAVNWTGDSSELGEYIYKDLKYPVALIFAFDGKVWKHSLRSSTIDTSEISVKRGGGGHPGASGFRTTDINWLIS